MKTAIIGLPMVGKTSLFTILTGVATESRVGQQAMRAGIAKVPDARLHALATRYPDARIIQATVEYLDAPAIAKETLREASYLGSLRVVDAFAHVVRVFEDPTVPHEHGTVDPLRDIDSVDTELILSDLVVVEKRLERLEKDRKKQKSLELDREFELLTQAKAMLEDNKPLRGMTLDSEDEKRVRGFQFLSQKPMLYVLNLGEEDASKLTEREAELRALVGDRPGTAVTAVCGKIEAELAELPAAEAAEYMASYGLAQSGLERIITATYTLLGLMSFLTAGDKEVRARTIPIGTAAKMAAGAIHTDLSDRFSRAKVIQWETIVEMGEDGAKAKGLVRYEGKEYIVKDGDVLEIL